MAGIWGWSKWQKGEACKDLEQLIRGENLELVRISKQQEEKKWQKVWALDGHGPLASVTPLPVGRVVLEEGHRRVL